MTDLRYAVRAITRRPGFALAAISSLAIGIAANTAVFSVTNGLLFKPVRGMTAHPDLVHVTHEVRGDAADLPYAVLHNVREQSSVMRNAAAFASVPVSLSVTGEPTVQGGLAIDAAYFDVLGVRALRGRLLAPEQASYPRVAPVAVVSEHLWQHVLGGRDDIIGLTVRINGVPVQVIGVVAFAGHQTGLRFDVFLPLGLSVPGLPSAQALDDVRSSSVEMIGRLQPGVSSEAASRALSTSVNAMRAARGITESLSGMKIGVVDWAPLPLAVRDAATALLALLSVLVGLALSMACMNVTTMLLARAAERRHEIAVRQALGASRARLTRQTLIEALLVFAIAGVVGTAATLLLMKLLGSYSPQLPIAGRAHADFSVDMRVLIVALIATLGTGFLFSVVPAVSASGIDIAGSLKSSAGTSAPARTRFRSTIVGIQIGVTTLLLIMAGLFATSLDDLRDADTGFEASNVHVLSMDLELRGLNAEQGRIFSQAVLQRVRAHPGVQSATFAAKLPMAGCSSLGPLATAPSQDHGSGEQACFNRVSPGYFRTLSLPVIEGRDLAETDNASSMRVAVVNQTLASRLYPNGSAIGRTFMTGPVGQRVQHTIVGVVANAKYRSLAEPPSAFYYIPSAQMYNSQMVLHVLAKEEHSTSVAGDIRRLVREVDPYLPIGEVRPLTEALDILFLPQRVASWVAALMGAFALLLATIGVYGITAYVITSRAREVGIRLALGATNRDILKLVVRRQLVSPLAGLVLGGAAGVLMTVRLSDVMASVSLRNPVAFGGAPMLVSVIALVAIVLPTARLLRGAPMSRLRE